MAKALLDKILRESSEEEQELRKAIEPTPDEEEVRQLYVALSEQLKDSSISQKDKAEAEEALFQIKGYTFFLTVVKPSLAILNHHCEKQSFFDCKEFLDKPGDIATVEEAYDVLIRLYEGQRKQVLIYANNYCALDKAVAEHDKQSFIKCCYETSQGMSEVLKICGFLKTVFELKDLPQQLDEIDELSKEDYDTIETEFIKPRLDIVTTACEVQEEIPEEGEEAVALDYAESVFGGILDCYLDPKLLLTKAESKVMEEIITSHPEFDDVIWPIYYKMLNQYDKNLCNYIARMTESKGEECIEVQRAKTYIEEHKAEVEGTKANTSGRNQGCWLIADTFAELNRWNTIIQIKVWPIVFKVVSAFKYTKTTSKKLEKAINNMGASLIYKAAENIGIAKEYSKNDVASSYARTMSFIGCERRDIKPYMEMLDVYMRCVEQDKQNKFESRHRLSGDESGTYSRRNSSYNEKMDSVDVRDILADYCNKNEEMAQFLANNKQKIKEALIMIRQLLSSHK